MPLRWRIALSLAWGTALGGLLAIQTAALLLSLGWVFLYGDEPWPAHFTDRIVPIAAGLAGVLGFVAVVAFAVWLRRSQPALERWLAKSAPFRWALIAAPVALMVSALWAVQRQDAAADRARAGEELVAARQAAAHRLVSAASRLDPSPGRLWIEIAAEGVAAGAYDLLWEARGVGVDEPLGAGSTRVYLPAGPAALTLDLDATELARRYARAILTRSEPVAIDMPIALELSLASEGLPPGEAGLRVAATLSFDYRPDGTVLFAAAP